MLFFSLTKVTESSVLQTVTFVQHETFKKQVFHHLPDRGSGPAGVFWTLEGEICGHQMQHGGSSGPGRGAGLGGATREEFV